MSMQKPFPHAGFLSQLTRQMASPSSATEKGLLTLPAGTPTLLDANGAPTPAAAHLIELLKAKQAMLRASLDTELAADGLRRYQKFAKPGQPSPHIVQLRQQQAGARQASSQSRQAFIAAAAAFVREAGMQVPARVALEVFIDRWIEANVPIDTPTSIQ
jgi:hypothetical protein